MRQHRGDEQKRRRIMPGEIAFVALAEDRDLNRLLDVPVVGKRRMTIEYQTARRPDIDEIGWNAEAVLIEDPPTGGEPALQHGHINDAEHKASDQERGRGRAPRRGHTE